MLPEQPDPNPEIDTALIERLWIDESLRRPLLHAASHDTPAALRDGAASLAGRASIDRLNDDLTQTRTAVVTVEATNRLLR